MSRWVIALQPVASGIIRVQCKLAKIIIKIVFIIIETSILGFTEEAKFKLSLGEQRELCKEETRKEVYTLCIFCTKKVIKCNLCSSFYLN